MNPQWPPSSHLSDYHGDYPRHELESARQTLINCLVYNQSTIVERVKPKLGLSSAFGPGMIPPALPQQSPKSNRSPRFNHSSPPSSNLMRPLLPELMAHRGSALNTQVHASHSQSHASLDVDGSLDDSGVFSQSSDTPNRSISSNLVAIPMADSSSSGGGDIGTNNRLQVALKRRSSTLESEEESAKKPRAASSDDSQSVVISSPGSSTDSTGAQIVYKCDFCSFTCLLAAQMNDHLVNSQHFSGSIYSAQSKPGSATGYSLLSIHKMLAVKNKFSKAKALVVVCPECKDIYEDIFMCGMHYKYKHGTHNGFYSICPVIHHETVTVPVEPVCHKCDEKFPKQRALHSHWAQFPEHHPIAKPANTRVFVLFICPYCQKTFYNNFLNCKGHVIDKHKSNGAVSRGVMAIEIKHVLLPMRKEELPPFNTSDESDGIRDELAILRNMRRHVKEMSGQKQKLVEISNRIKLLNTLSPSTTA